MGLHVFNSLCFSMVFLHRYYHVASQQSFDLYSSLFPRIVSTSTFVDKTLFIKEFIVNNKISLITAPPGFGKSTNLDMLKSFLEIEVSEDGQPISRSHYVMHSSPFTQYNNVFHQVKDTPNYKLFTDHDLHITKEKQIMEDYFGKSPVMRVTFKCTRPIHTFDDAFNFLKEASHNAFKQHRYLSKSHYLSGAEREYYSIWCNDREYHMFGKHIVTFCLRELASFLSRHFGNRPVFVIVDDHDSLTKEAMLNVTSDEEFEGIVRLSSVMLNYLFKNNTRYVWGGLMSGVSPLPVFKSSNLNLVSPNDYYLYCFLGDHHFTDFYGLTKEDVDSLLVKNKHKVGEQVIEAIPAHHGGYCSNSGKVIYNMYSIVKGLQHGVIENYWSNFKTIPNFNNILKVPAVNNAVKTLLTGGTISLPMMEGNFTYYDVLATRNMLLNPQAQSSTVVMKFFCYLFDEGYLTPTVNQKSAFKIPNDEIKAAFTQHMNA